jgi:hypothetical protein
MPNSGPGGTKPPQLQVPPRINRAQPNVRPSVSNPNPVKNVSHQFDPFGGVISGAKRLGSSVAHGAGSVLRGAVDNIFGDAKERQTAQQRVHDVTGPQTTVITPGYNDTGRIDAISGYPIGKWKWNQDNSAGAHANWIENANGKDEHGRPTTPATGSRLDPKKNENFNYKGMNVTINDFKPERDANGNLERDKNGNLEWDDWKPVTTIVPPKIITTQGTGANQGYQLGKQGVVGGSGSYQLGSALTANNAAVSGRASGALTQGGWTQGAASGNSSGGPSGTANFVNNGGGASASGLSGISSDTKKVRP